MKIVMIGNERQKEEWESSAPGEGIQWLASIQELVAVANVDACINLLYDENSENASSLQKIKVPLIIISSVVEPLEATTRRYVRINGWNTFLKRNIVEASVVDETIKAKTEAIFSTFEKKVEWQPNHPGFLTARVIASIINEAFFALEEEVSTKEDVDTAMKLGTNYPYGPFEWCEKIGVIKVASLLKRLSIDEPRYTPAPLLLNLAGL